MDDATQATVAVNSEDALREALDAAHFYIDASPDELADLGITRDDALRIARDKRAALRATDDAGGA